MATAVQTMKLKALPKSLPPWARDPRMLIRVGLGVLLAVDLATAALVFKPWAASTQQMEAQASSLRRQIGQKQAALTKLRTIVSKVEGARSDGDRFMDKYLLSRRTVASNLLDELEQTARKAGIRQKNASFVFEPIEGSDTLTKATITADYEGTYADLIQFMNLMDRSPRFLILEYLEAKPQQQGMTLGILLKLDALVREGGQADSAVPVTADAPAPAGAAPIPAPVVRPQLPQPQRGFQPAPAQPQAGFQPASPRLQPGFRPGQPIPGRPLPGRGGKVPE